MSDPTIECIENGPYIVKDLDRLEGPDGDDLGADERIALCRCGESGDKPFCDGTHKEVGFEAAGTDEPDSAGGDGGTIRVLADGPLRVEGAAIEVDDAGPSYALCRCGASGNKPLCDGSHRDVGFTDPAR